MNLRRFADGLQDATNDHGHIVNHVGYALLRSDEVDEAVAENARLHDAADIRLGSGCRKVASG